MKKQFIYLTIIALLPLFILTGCREDPPESEVAEYDTLTTYMTENTMDLSDILAGWVKPGTVDAIGVNVTDWSVPEYYIMDFRGADDFNAGHIKGAHNVAFGSLLTAAPTDKSTKILCVCYTGQTAARATGFLRMAGYSKAATLKWGMCGWNADLNAKWNANAVDVASPSWVSTGTPEAVTTFDNPTLSTGKTDGSTILSERITAAMAMDWKATKTDVLDAPASYFVNNKWPQDAWDEYGHIANAYRINEDLLINGLKNLDPDANMVTYCYTGQTSSITTAWLQVMGFDKARSLLFGANGINHSALVVGDVGGAHKKSWHGVGSSSELNWGYYQTDGVDQDAILHNPLP